MPADTLLADLCGICHTQQPKYRCPGCHAKTCSLPCYKKHQQRASCTGKRNPAAYLKKSQWTTPAAIDQDYNYLRSVERAIDQANPTTSADDTLSESTLKNVLRGKHPESRLQKYLSQNRIQVENAPLGMSRQKSNQTRSTKSNNIVWTIEWVFSDQDDRRHLEHDCLESTSIAGTYASLHLDKVSRGVKRKRETRLSTTTHISDDPTRPPDQPEASDERPPLSARTETAAKEYSFYLLRPNTTSSSKILVPLNPTSTVTEALTNRTVLEYPTFYVFSSPEPTSPKRNDEGLPEGYMLEDDYLAQRKDEEAELQEMLGQTPRPDQGKGKQRRTEGRRDGEEEDEVDAEGILDMLRRDVGR